MARSKAVLEAPAAIEPLERLLATGTFEVSSRGRAILRFMLGEMLEHRQESLSLATIARQVFRRGDDFAPERDPAVRIEIARVRRALDRYYRLPGASEPVRISLPRGAFVPVAGPVVRALSPSFETAPARVPRP